MGVLLEFFETSTLFLGLKGSEHVLRHRERYYSPLSWRLSLLKYPAAETRHFRGKFPQAT